MKRYSALMAIMLIGGVTASAQYRDGGPGYREGYGREGNVIGRVMGDVDFASRNSYVDRGEQQRMRRVRDDLQRFDERWRRGQWDQGRLDSAIGNLSHLADSRRMNPRDRQMMFNDANLLREFRSNRGRFNGSPSGGSYRR